MSEKSKKIIKKVCTALWWVLIVLSAFLIIRVVGAKVQGKVPKIFGYSVMQVVTGSMQPTIPAGSYILVKETDAEKISEDDIISFYSDDPAIHGLPNTHKVVGIIKTDEGIEFKTQGEAAGEPDSVTAKDDKLIGVYVRRLDGLTGFSEFLANGGIFAIMIIIWTSTACMVGYTFYKKQKSEEQKAEMTGEKDE